MSTVTNWEEIEVNIRTMEAARVASEASTRKEYIDFIRNGICFLAYTSDAGIAFAPSKFVGYINNDFSEHIRYRNNQDKDPNNLRRHGGDTNKAIEKIVDTKPKDDPEAEQLYQDFCRQLGFEPKSKGTAGNQRKYWRLESLIDISNPDKTPTTSQRETTNPASSGDINTPEAEGAALAAIVEDDAITATEKEQLIKARVGQGDFRDKLLLLHKKTCCLTGCKVTEILRASHIKPWSQSDNRERLDPYNGLLLTPNIDALFDQGFITFSDEGELLVSDSLPVDAKKLLLSNCKGHIQIRSNNLPYLDYHRKKCFQHPGQSL